MSSAVPIRKKRYHKRSSWACDECKLRKKKCDGEQPCAMCVLIGTACTFLSRTRPHKPPTQRVRELEEQARSFRELLGRLKHEVSSPNVAEIERLLSGFDNTPSDGSQGANSPSVTGTSFNVPLTSILDGRGKLLQSGRNKSLFFGPCSTAALVCAILDFFDGTDSSLIHPLVLDVFERDTTSFLGEEASETLMNMAIPSQEEMVGFMHIIRQQTHPSFQIIETAELLRILNLSYAHEASNTPSAELSFVHAVAALGYLLSTDRHTRDGCSWNVSKSTQHYRISMSTLSSMGINDVLSLLICVYLVFFDCCAFKMSEAYAVIGVAQSMIIRQGLHQLENETSTRVLEDLGLPLKQIIMTLEIIDCLVSTTLGLPRVMTPSVHELLEPNPSEPSALDIRLQAVYSLTNSTTSIISEISAVILEKGTAPAPKKPIDQALLEQADQNINRYSQMLDQFAATHNLENTSRTPKQGLLTTFWWSELTVYSPFLHYLQPLAEGQSLPPHLSEPALRCLKAATNTINACEGMLRSRADSPFYARIIHPGNVGTVNALFTSTLSLIFLICVHKGTKPPGEAWRRAEMGIRLLEALRCEAGGAGQCILVIRELVRQLHRFVYFDFDHLERTTQRVCFGDSGHHSSSVSVDSLPMNVLPGQLNTSPNHLSMSADEMLAYARHLDSGEI